MITILLLSQALAAVPHMGHKFHKGDCIVDRLASTDGKPMVYKIVTIDAWGFKAYNCTGSICEQLTVDLVNENRYEAVECAK